MSLYFLYEIYLSSHTNLDEYIIHNLILLTEKALSIFHIPLIQYSEETFKSRVGIQGSTGLFIGKPCNGYALFSLFIAFIIAFPGSIKHKLWFIPCGLVAIHVINAFRVIALVIIVNKKPEWLEFNHDYTFTILVYAFVFVLWWTWINYFSPLKAKSSNASIEG